MFTSNSKATSITIIWEKKEMICADKRERTRKLTIPAGRATINRLAPNTTYFFYPFWSRESKAVLFVKTSVAVGFPRVAFTFRSIEAMTQQNKFGRVPLCPEALMASTAALAHKSVAVGE